ncbi:MAG: UvrD-helicase domain-containing protein [Euryarchaeota archaeon]|nr:UvrD-helicase domain-containing protein [Euryarchaeota archaeon]
MDDHEPMDDTPLQPQGNQPAVLAATGDEIKIEAVAGSGKTTTMVWRIRDEIHTRETPPNRILVLTFAKEATHNVQEKLREELGASDSFDVDVYNYHSFCYQLLQEYAYHSGLSPDFELITEDQRPQLIESVYTSVDFEFAPPSSPAASGPDQASVGELTDFIGSMRREAIDPAAIREYLPDDETLAELIDLQQRLEGAAHDLINVDANDIMWDAETIADNCEQLARVYRFKATGYDQDTDLSRSVGAHLDAMAECADSVAGYLRTETNLSWKEYRLPEILFEDTRGPFEGIKQTPMGRFSEYVTMLRRVRAYISAYEAYTEELDDRGALDYDELIHKAVELMNDSEVREDILSQWDVVFCDEFQDTDSSQLNLVDELRSEMEIMVIGDSDQAIYEWRGQDPDNMSNLPDSFEEITLPDNFRSRQAILDITNNLGRDTQQIHSKRSADPPSVFKINSEGAETEQQVSTTISQLLADRIAELEGHKLSDIAVLVRKNRHAKQIADQLDQESIPYTLSAGSDEAVSHGFQTVLSYLRILVEPGDDVSWQRVLLLLYRVPEADVDRLLAAGETVPEGFEAVSPSALDRPERLQEALSEYETLQKISATHSVSELYSYMKRETKLEWFLRDADRDRLQSIEQLISSFSDSPVQLRLTPEFLSYLERQADLLTASEETATSQGTKSEGAIDIMTVHQVKGLDFDTVLLPYLAEDEFATLSNYQTHIYSYDMLVDGIEGTLDDPLRSDISEAQIAEEWRILHVALTRAKNQLFLFGTDLPERIGDVPLVDQQLPGSDSETPIDWSASGPRLPIWSALTDSYDAIAETAPNEVRDITEPITRGVGEDPGTITYYQQPLSTADAIEQVLAFADGMVERTLDTDTDTVDGRRYADVPLGVDQEIQLARQHSHSALEAVRDCGRRHVLDYVVDAFPDPVSERDGQRGVTQADIGTLFHDVAELAYWRDYTTVEEWTTACRWIGQRYDGSDCVEAAIDCIESYFETPVPEWTAVGAEVPIELDEIDGLTGTVTGYVDAVCEYPDGGLAVIDYKTSQSKKTLAESYQLLLYVRGCADRFEEEITHAGYVYVGDPGPAVQLFAVEEIERQWDDLHADLLAADASTFDDVEAGPHCEFCEHRSLGCSEPPFEYTDDLRLD